jgi:hypothetical protein
LHDQRIDSCRANQPSPESPQSPTSVIFPRYHAREYSWPSAGGKPDPYRTTIGINYRPPPWPRILRALDNLFARKYMPDVGIIILANCGLDESGARS